MNILRTFIEESIDHGGSQYRTFAIEIEIASRAPKKEIPNIFRRILMFIAWFIPSRFDHLRSKLSAGLRSKANEKL